MALKIIKAMKKAVSIKMMIHEALAGWEPPRNHDTLHASDLMKALEFCPREFAFIQMGLAKKKGSFVGTALRITFDHGRDMEWRLRNEWLRHVISGWWKCGVCGTRHKSFGKAPQCNCPKCGYGHQWEYDEVNFVSPKSGISGAIDAIVDVKEPKLRILEIKSIAIDAFRKLEAPLAEHKFRTSLYMRLAGESHLPESERVNSQEANILYVAKSFGVKDESMKEAGISDSAFSPFKEFTIQRDDSLVETPVNKAKVYTFWKHTQEGMPCGVCVNGLTKRAQSCSAVSACFSGHHTSTLTWLANQTPAHAGKIVID